MVAMRVALAIGDAGGIGPELAARVLADRAHHADDTTVLGDRRLLERGARDAGVSLELPTVPLGELGGESPVGSFMVDLGNCDPGEAPVGRATEAGGRAALENFRAALLACRAGHADVAFFTPFNKHAMRLAEPGYVDEIGFVDRVIGATRSGREFNVLDEVWNARVTSHVPLREVVGLLSEDRVVESLVFTDEIMRAAGFERPRIGVAALNPHAGDGRNFGDEDEDMLAPAVGRAVAAGVVATGPVPSDTVFVRAVRGEFDAVLTLFHDQGQIAMKLIGFDRGVTLIAGYPFPIVTPAHGTAYDIAGQGIADTGATTNAVALGRRLAARLPRSAADRPDTPLAEVLQSARQPAAA